MKQVVIFNYQQLCIVELQYQMRSEKWNEWAESKNSVMI